MNCLYCGEWIDVEGGECAHESKGGNPVCDRCVLDSWENGRNRCVCCSPDEPKPEKFSIADIATIHYPVEMLAGYPVDTLIRIAKELDEAI